MPGLLVVTPPGPEADALAANLKDRGFDVQLAANGASAVDVALRRLPDVILMDPSLSAMDRWHAVKRLNTDLATSRIPVLTLASDATSPAGLQRVLAKVQRTLGGGPIESVPPTSSQPPAVKRVPEDVVLTPPPKRPARSDEVHGSILVVDDNAMNRDMLSRRLARRGYDVDVAEDGHQALAKIERGTVQGGRFDLVLLDWMMPGLSGIDVLKKLRETYSPVMLPVIMATAKTEAEDIVEALRAEANDYVTKPLNFDVVNARIRTALSLVKAHQDLSSSERRYRALLENTGDMIVQFRRDGSVLYVSPASTTLLGYKPSELKRRSFYDWIHTLDRQELEEKQRTQERLPRAYSFIARMGRSDGKFIWVETSCRLLTTKQETLIQAACRDVTEHMDRLAGDEPPLPLGGDIMTHPGWRGGQSRPPATERAYAPSSPPGATLVSDKPSQVVLVMAVDGLSVDQLSRDQLTAELGKRVVAALEERNG